MIHVLLALLPAVVVRSVLDGAGTLALISACLIFALASEALMLKLRGQPIVRHLTDFSAALTAVLFALLAPATTPWWVAAFGIGVAIVLAKQLFGGLGKNLFNPAIAGLVAARLCYPQVFQVTQPLANNHFVSGTPGLHLGFSQGTNGEYWLAAAYVIGGLFLLWKKIMRWQASVATLVAASASTYCWIAFAAEPASSSTSPLAPALWLLIAFFIVTDPVTGCVSAWGRLIFGAVVGAAGVSLACWHGDPYGFAYVLLLMNCAAPWIDRRAMKLPGAGVAPNIGSPA